MRCCLRSHPVCRVFFPAAIFFAGFASLFAQAPLPDATSKASEGQDAIALGLKWLAERQSPDGSWTFATETNPGSFPQYRVAATSLAVLPFLRAGHTPQDGHYKDTISKGLAFITSRMKENGDLRDGATMYTQGLGTMVLTEAYARTKTGVLRGPSQASVDFILSAQDPHGGGWRYNPRQSGDTSVLGWQFAALIAAKQAGFRVPPQAFEGAARYLDTVQSEEGASYGYTRPGVGSMSMRAVGLLCRTHLGWGREKPALGKGVEQIAGHGPQDDAYFNYYATQLMNRYGGKEWQEWRSAMEAKLTGSQDKEGPTAGSWFSAEDAWNQQLGRLGLTSLCLMTLEVGQEQQR